MHGARQVFVSCRHGLTGVSFGTSRAPPVEAESTCRRILDPQRLPADRAFSTVADSALAP
jgi:hypothetical protein